MKYMLRQCIIEKLLILLRFIFNIKIIKNLKNKKKKK